MLRFFFNSLFIFCLILYIIRGHYQLIILGLLYFLMGYLSQFLPVKNQVQSQQGLYKKNEIYICKPNGEILINYNLSQH